MQEYKVVKVSEQEPKKWEGPNGTIWYIKTMLEGHDKPVSIGKKSIDALKVGDTVYGEIQPTDYVEDKFKAGKKPFVPNGGYNDPDKQAQIKAQWAIGQAIAMDAKPSEVGMSKFDGIEETAKILFAMVDRVKGGVVESGQKKDWVAPEIRQKLQEAKKTNDELDAEMNSLIDSEEEIDLESIPF